ncbi:hypothetical protein GCM10010269_51540 [Streptomyces humidus]|uniref:Alpha-L-arabinofuranosidase B catalytic domain-containing protein n=1 Tax=Streptomyces humidus TaxID=52259 RepID=A0A918FZS4_9ACTN|nr:arabinofuranosidase catalytic domain-containing protein [Streptomyces humidus]GGS06217.1 hypothetical protein GCM10010269_51540 [Streptomyces humidus]
MPAASPRRRPLPRGYDPVKKQGAIILGSGGDRRNGDAGLGVGTFHEGAVVAGHPCDATEDTVRAGIAAARHR